MKNNSWYLWLNGKKIFNIRELRENFDTPVIAGYFLGGSLMKWLSDAGEYSLVKRLATVDINEDIGKQLEFAFGVSPDKKYDKEIKLLPENPPLPERKPVTVTASSFGAGTSYFSGTESSFLNAVFSSETESSFISSLSSSYGIYKEIVSELASTSGYNLSSYSSFVSGQALSVASSGMLALTGSSFMNLLVSGGFGLTGSFGSFTLSSYKGFLTGISGSFGSFGKILLGSGIYFGKYGMIGGSIGSFGSLGGSFASFGEFFENGSFVYKAGNTTITAEEYHRTLINLSSCPLNAYGYGINLI